MSPLSALASVSAVSGVSASVRDTEVAGSDRGKLHADPIRAARLRGGGGLAAEKSK